MTRFEDALVEIASLKMQHSCLNQALDESETKLNTYAEENQLLKEKLSEYTTYAARLEEFIRLKNKERFTPSSEKFLNNDQLVFNEFEKASAESSDEEDDSDEVQVKAHSKKRPKRKPLPKDLPRVIDVIDLKEEEKICPHDGTPLKCIGEERSERIDVIPLQMKIIETVRKKYACPCCSEYLKTAKPRLEMIPKGLPTAGTLAYIATSKYCDGLSLYHIEEVFARHGVEVSRQSMARWMVTAGERLEPLLNLLREELLSRPYLQIDETTLQVLNELDRKSTSKSYMWVRCSPLKSKPIVLFDYSPSRASQVAKSLLEDFKGKLHCDGYGGYNFIETDELSQKMMLRYGCLTHARRKFYEAAKASKKANIAKHCLKLIQKIFHLEGQQARGRPPDEVLRLRQEELRPIFDKLTDFVEDKIDKVPPKSLTGKALIYFKTQHPRLSRLFEDGEVELSTNIVENHIRPFAIGRKRWLFCATPEGAHASAALYSLVETAKANKVEPYAYLRAVFTGLPKAETLEDFEALLPWSFKKKPS